MRQNFIILLCVFLLLNTVLRWSIPVWLIIIILFFIWLGSQIFGSSNAANGKERVCFRNWVNTNPEVGKEYDYIFSNANVDLTEQSPSDLTLNAVFSSVRLRLPVDANVHLRASGSFCSIKLPDGQTIAFGDEECDCGSKDAHAPTLTVNVRCVFGSVECIVG